MTKQLPSPDVIRQTFDYDPQAGHLTWRNSRGRVSKGEVAGSLGVSGYVSVQVNGMRLRAHRVAWAHFHGVWPALDLDHKDGNGANNRIENLREVTAAENLQNLRSAKSHSATGLLGAYRWRTKFKAQIVVNGKCKHVGTFETKEEAHAAYVQAKRLLHPMGTL